MYSLSGDSTLPSAACQHVPAFGFHFQHASASPRFQQVSFSRFGLTLPRTTNRYQRQSGTTLMARLREELLKC
ncbi:MAG: hypothetical protein AVDCRST_MAG58-154 [uncultured Rubrobacteraceae bacterium]|uniref:Uncharacterized protein n=1 Tax=uncultured Rubrobacteraceae bacterium TaxID=349277 RepID=A0A6J4QFA3_9ACTN|nr:MAG: hypothetical protein AVDCRST_MAG58-154 [uncultured Rubrobacteraceae bacterium]